MNIRFSYNTEIDALRFMNVVHDMLVGNKDYIDSNIVLNGVNKIDDCGETLYSFTLYVDTDGLPISILMNNNLGQITSDFSKIEGVELWKNIKN